MIRAIIRTFGTVCGACQAPILPEFPCVELINVSLDFPYGKGDLVLCPACLISAQDALRRAMADHLTREVREIRKAAPESTSRKTVPVRNPRPYSMNDLYSHICREAQKLK